MKYVLMSFILITYRFYMFDLLQILLFLLHILPHYSKVLLLILILYPFYSLSCNNLIKGVLLLELLLFLLFCCCISFRNTFCTITYKKYFNCRKHYSNILYYTCVRYVHQVKLKFIIWCRIVLTIHLC